MYTVDALLESLNHTVDLVSICWHHSRTFNCLGLVVILTFCFVLFHSTTICTTCRLTTMNISWTSAAYPRPWKWFVCSFVLFCLSAQSVPRSSWLFCLFLVGCVVRQTITSFVQGSSIFNLNQPFDGSTVDSEHPLSFPAVAALACLATHSGVRGVLISTAVYNIAPGQLGPFGPQL